MTVTYQYLAPNKEQCLIVEPAGLHNDEADALGFVVGDTMVRKGVILPLRDVQALFDALGEFLSGR